MVFFCWSLYKYYYLKKVDIKLYYYLRYEYSDEYDNLYWIVELAFDSFYFYWYDKGPDEDYDLDFIPWYVTYIKIITCIFIYRIF
jgi:hypothetical protein